MTSPVIPVAPSLHRKTAVAPTSAGSVLRRSGAAAGVSFDETLAKLGIADQMKPKIKLAQGGAGAMKMLADGEVDYGLTFVSEIITEPGVEVVGPLPREISTPTSLVAFLSADSKQPDAAKALLAFLSSPEAAAVYAAMDMPWAKLVGQIAQAYGK